MPVIYWCVNRTLGLRLAGVFFASQYLNEVLKGIVAEPRPGPPVVPLDQDTAPGTAWPSGHAENSAALWGAFAGLVRRGWLLALAVALTLLVGFSRLYLGLHWPIDVVSGWLIGAVLAAAALALIASLPRFTARLVPPLWLVLAVIGVVALVLVYPTDTTPKVGGAVAGMLIGWWLERRLVGFEAPAPPVTQGLKAVLGLVVAFALRAGLKPVFALLPGAVLPDLLRYFLIVLWVIWLAPALFVRVFGQTPIAEGSPAEAA